MPSLRVYTFGHEHLASTRFRFKEIENNLAAKFTINASIGRPTLWSIFSDWNYDAIYLQKVLPPLGWWAALNSLRTRPHIVYDFDDAIWEREGKSRSWVARKRLDVRLKAAWRNADIVTTCSEYLASFAKPYARKISVIPIAVSKPVDSNQHRRSGERRYIGWSGHAWGHYLLTAIDQPLAEFVKRFPEYEVLILSGKRPNLRVPFEWLEWNPKNEAEYFEKVAICAVPLINGKIEMGKSPAKIIQHIAHGVPVVSNGLGGTEEIARGGGVLRVSGSPDSWLDAFSRLASDRQFYEQTSNEAVQNFQAHYDLEEARKQFMKAFDFQR